MNCGDGSCMGCGEKTAIHLFTATVTALMQPRVKKAVARLDELIKRLEAHIRLKLAEHMDLSNTAAINEAVAKHRISPSITPDGPHGPRREFKPGAILLSQMTGRPILPIAYAARRAWLFPTWDRFVLPWPFTRIVLAVGEPRVVPKGLDSAGLARWQAEMRDELNALFEQAQAAQSARD